MTFFDADIAARYDATLGERASAAVLGPTVEFLAALAGDGSALEFAIGTGRVALPLSAAGVDVYGLEISQPMVDQMLAKPGADRIPVTIGDMAVTRVAGTFQLVYLVFNTITNLLSQDEQVDCFKNAAAHLAPGGHFVVEVLVPSLRRLGVGETFIPFDVSSDHLGMDEYDTLNQRSTSHHYWVTDGTAVVGRSEHRYAWPAEYDLMARLAGMELSERWANWQREPFTAESASHVSVWTRA